MQQSYINIIKKLKRDNPTITKDDLSTKIYDTIKGALYEKYSASSPGYIYCLHNEVYKYYGPNYYKLGKCDDIKKGRVSHVKSFLKESKIVYISKRLKNIKIAQYILFQQLDNYRYDKSRELFNCDLKKIKEVFSKIERMFNEFSIYQIIDKYIFNDIKKYIDTYIDKKYNDIIKKNKFIICKLNYLMNDAKSNLSNTIIKKIDYYKRISSALNIQNLIEYNYDRDKIHFKDKIEDEDLLNNIDDIKKCFKIQSDKYRDLDKRGGYRRLYKMCISICKDLFGNDILISKFKNHYSNNKKRESQIYYFNKDYFYNLGLYENK